MDVKSPPVEKNENDLISRLPEEMDLILEFQRSIGTELYILPRRGSIVFQKSLPPGKRIGFQNLMTEREKGTEATQACVALFRPQIRQAVVLPTYCLATHCCPHNNATIRPQIRRAYGVLYTVYNATIRPQIRHGTLGVCHNITLILP